MQIYFQLFKYCYKELTPFLCKLSNDCITSSSLLDEWKLSIVSPLYKGKGNNDCFDNYRGISVLSLIAKIFETIISSQMVDYFDKNNLFSSSQHGFRSNHSCETAILSIVDHWKSNIDKKLINLAIFIDFKKAFDLVQPKLLFTKLFHYGFGNNSLMLMNNYFTDRYQQCRIGNSLSFKVGIELGVPQGSILGPL